MLVVGGVAVSHAQSDPDISWKSPRFLYYIPRKYVSPFSTVVDKRLAAIDLDKDQGAFSFRMPDGAPFERGYGRDEVGDIAASIGTYPIVVSEVSADQDKIAARMPERQLARGILMFTGNGRETLSFAGSKLVLDYPLVHGPALLSTYTQIPEVKSSGKTSAILRCNRDQAEPVFLGYCDGWLYTEGLGLVMRVEYPRRKSQDFVSIAQVILGLLQSWQIN